MHGEAFGLLHGTTDGGYRVNVAGELDIAATTSVTRAVEGYRRSSVPDVLVDMTDLTFADSTAAAFLDDLAQVSRDRCGRTVLLNPCGRVLRILTLLDVTAAVEVQPAP